MFLCGNPMEHLWSETQWKLVAKHCHSLVDVEQQDKLFLDSPMIDLCLWHHGSWKKQVTLAKGNRSKQVGLIQSSILAEVVGECWGNLHGNAFD